MENQERCRGCKIIWIFSSRRRGIFVATNSSPPSKTSALKIECGGEQKSAKKERGKWKCFMIKIGEDCQTKWVTIEQPIWKRFDDIFESIGASVHSKSPSKTVFNIHINVDSINEETAYVCTSVQAFIKWVHPVFCIHINVASILDRFCTNFQHCANHHHILKRLKWPKLNEVIVKGVK